MTVCLKKKVICRDNLLYFITIIVISVFSSHYYLLGIERGKINYNNNNIRNEVEISQIEKWK